MIITTATKTNSPYKRKQPFLNSASPLPLSRNHHDAAAGGDDDPPAASCVHALPWPSGGVLRPLRLLLLRQVLRRQGLCSEGRLSVLQGWQQV